MIFWSTSQKQTNWKHKNYCYL